MQFSLSGVEKVPGTADSFPQIAEVCIQGDIDGQAAMLHRGSVA
jgi:hypothetical protein